MPDHVFARIWDLETTGRSRLSKNYDLFIGGCGSDTRAYSALRSLVKKRTSLGEVLLLDFAQRSSAIVDASERAQYDSYESIGPRIKVQSCSPLESRDMRGIGSELLGLPSGAKVALDISVLTKPYIFAVMRAISEIPGLGFVHVLYTEPGRYLHTPSGTYPFSKGPYRVVDIPGFAGRLSGPKDVLLVLLLGFEGSASKAVFEELTPAKVVPVNGFPSYLLHYKDESIVQNDPLFEQVAAIEDLQFAPAANPFETFNVLGDLKKEADQLQLSLVISPIGPKPMALGAALFCLHHPEARVVYPMPASYEGKVSTDLGKSWLYEVEFPTASLPGKSSAG